jgi:hypothetical protein
MIFVFADDRMITVLPDVAAVRLECESVDVEDGAYCFFDEQGRPLIPRIISPVQRTSLPFGLQSAGNGRFELELDPNAEVGAFDRLMANAVGIEPNQWFETLSDLARNVSGKQGIQFEKDRRKLQT